MPNSSFLSDSDSDSNSEYAAAVKELLSQTKDLCVLEQVSAINCASFSGDSVLASDLESRFARLKSFPSSSSAAKPSTASARRDNPKPSSIPASPSPVSSKRFGSGSETPSLPPSSSNSSPAPNKTKRPENSTNPKARSLSSSESSPVDPRTRSSGKGRETAAKRFDSAGDGSPSMGCTFWCSPKKSSSSSSSSRRRKEIREVDWARRSDFGWSRNEEILEDLGSFSVEEQRKILRKAMAEQKKISTEARKIVKMAKKASIGKSVHGVDDHHHHDLSSD